MVVEVNCTEVWKDISDVKTARALFVLAFLNVFVIALGCYSFFLRLRAKDADTVVVIFYTFALTCLTVAEIYFLSSLWMGNICATQFIQNYPAYAYLITGFTFLYISLRTLNTNREQQSEDINERYRARKVFFWIKMSLWTSVAVITIFYISMLGNECNHSQSRFLSKLQGAFFGCAYLFTFCLMMATAYKEIKLLKAKFGSNLGNPLWRSKITSYTYASSFLIRTFFNFYHLGGENQLLKLQENSCENNAVGWALLMFFLHFAGEVFPLAVLFWMQIVLSRQKAEWGQARVTIGEQSEIDRFTIPRNEFDQKKTESSEFSEQKRYKFESYDSNFNFAQDSRTSKDVESEILQVKLPLLQVATSFENNYQVQNLLPSSDDRRLTVQQPPISQLSSPKLYRNLTQQANRQSSSLNDSRDDLFEEQQQYVLQEQHYELLRVRGSKTEIFATSQKSD